MSWKESAQAKVAQSEENSEYERELLTTGGIGVGSMVRMEFEDDGEEVETEHGDAIAWDVTVTDAGELDDFEDDDEARFLTGSTRFLKALLALEIDSLEGVEVEIIRTAGGYDTDYRIVEVGDE